MSYTTQQDILDFVEDNNVKFVRLDRKSVV